MVTKIVYLAHDLHDPAIHRRLMMLRAGGAELAAAGFRRSKERVPSIEGVEAVDLGRSWDGRLLRRAASSLAVAARPGRLAALAEGADVILARNLETLLPASRLRRRHAPGAALVYECLDLHRLLFSRSPAGRALRAIEDRLLRRTDLLLTSSPAYLRDYFRPRGHVVPARLVENKVLCAEGLEEESPEEDGAALRPARAARPGPPWRIGWFGVLRCRRTLEILSALAVAAGGAVEIVIRGRPSPAVFSDLPGAIAAAPHVRFCGAYRNPQDLPDIYGGVHFAWAIDYYEAGMNAAWLLSNRLYESSLHGAVPLALAQVETGRWLARFGAGVLLEDPPERQLAAFFQGLDGARYERLAEAVRRIPRRALVATAADCRELVEALKERRPDGFCQ